MKSKILSLVFLCVFAFAKAQVGIGTTSPQATLDIPASNPATPAAEDGILIPRIDQFPATNPTAAQDGMMVFATGNGTPTKGFYYWDNTLTAWIGVSGTTAGADRIDDLLDGKSDNDGTQNGSSVYLGIDAGLNDNSTDNQNIGIGFQSLLSNVNGANNLAIGNTALASVINQGFNNIAIGNDALSTNTNGDDNVAIGNRVMQSNTLSRFNVAIGSRALTTTTTNGQNTAVGYESLTANTGGTNTALGYQSLTADTNGIENVAVGHQAGFANTGNGNIFIGKSAGALETTANNRLYIENSNANADNALLYGEFDNDILRANGELQINNPSGTGYAFPVADGIAGQVMTTDGAGNLSFQDVAATTDTDDQQIDVLNLNGTNLEISLQDDGVATQTLDLSSLLGGDITGVTAGAGLTGGGTTGNPILNAAANNGLTVDAAADRIQLGGTLTEQTTITQGTFSFTHNLSSTGDFLVQDNGTNRFAVLDNGSTAVGGITAAGTFNVTGNSYFSDDLFLRDGAVNSGDFLIRLYDSSDDGVIDVYQGGAVRNRIHGNADSYFNGGEVGFGTTIPSATVDIVGDFQYVDGNQSTGYLLTSDASGNASWSDPSLIAGAERINDLIDGKSDNISIYLGVGAGANDIGNRRNISIGFNTLTANLSGEQNTAMGYQSLESNVSGDGNVGIGYLSLLSNVQGDSNIAIGRGALTNNIAGNWNTALGEGAGGTGTTGDDNVYLGRIAGNNNSGSDNVFVGSFAGFANITGNGNVFLGRSSGSQELGSNKLYIENTGSPVPLIYGTFDTNEVGINWNSATALPNTLSVNGNASKTTAGAWLANSDARLKKDIKTMDSQAILDKVLAMRGVTYFWNDGKTGLERPDTIQYGFIAQDLQQIWPTKVSEDGQGYLQTAYGDYDAMFVEAFKAQQDQINNLKKENQELKNQAGKYASLEARLQQLEEQLGPTASPNPVASRKED